MGGYFHWENLKLRYLPFPIGLIKPVMDQTFYARLIQDFPSIEHFVHVEEFGNKYSLSEKFNAKKYTEIVKNHPTWQEFHHWVKSRNFLHETLNALRLHHIDLGVSPDITLSTQIGRILRAFFRTRSTRIPHRLRSRFEFAMLPAAGGNVLPHTDSPGKIITFVISIVRDGEWNQNHGGGTDVNQPVRVELLFNQKNRQARFEDMEILDTYEFTPNQAVVFVKTFNSWHSVRPMAGTDTLAMRKTLTINIEEY